MILTYKGHAFAIAPDGVTAILTIEGGGVAQEYQLVGHMSDTAEPADQDDKPTEDDDHA